MAEKDRNICGNCHAQLKENDKFCVVCGTRRGEGKFKPEDNEMYCVYGPPIKQIYRCRNCGYQWEISTLGGIRADFCPQCGKKMVSLLSEEIEV